jgi:hypothetical protein
MRYEKLNVTQTKFIALYHVDLKEYNMPQEFIELLEKYDMTIMDLEKKLHLYGMLNDDQFHCEDCLCNNRPCIHVFSKQAKYPQTCLTRMFPTK